MALHDFSGSRSSSALLQTTVIEESNIEAKQATQCKMSVIETGNRHTVFRRH